MKKYIALLRGINVGGNNKVSMQELKKVFEGLVFDDVSTYINSGNVIFSSDKRVDAEKIENGLEKGFGFSIKVVVRDAENIQKLAKEIPSNWKNDADMKTDVLFLWDEFNKKETIELLNSKENIDTLLYFDGAIVWHILRENYNKSAMHAFIGSVVYKNMTARNVNTVRKLAEMLK
ncbi:DUF1697 domain-containing protein [Candidatus Woesebacteria bacterium]|nr:DUF1697 domain-containing protein [Candidatus Woesebacteria bacterium]